MKTAVIYSEHFLHHNPGEGHPESPERLKRIIGYIKSNPQFRRLEFFEPRPATINEIEYVHRGDYIQRVARICERGGGNLDPDTVLSRESFNSALLAVGAGLTASDLIMEGKVRNAFCAVRPPGHHAEADRGMGFCIFNNVAITARYLQKKYSIERILIIDWDVHHGNGTQQIFEEDDSVFYFSIHQYPHYPMTGRAEERGTGKGEGFTLNVPLSPGADDKVYLIVFRELLNRLVENFKPQFILISAGFDCHRGDPLGGMLISEAGFYEITKIVVEWGKKFAEGRIISYLEGGYSNEYLPLSVGAHLLALMEEVFS